MVSHEHLETYSKTCIKRPHGMLGKELRSSSVIILGFFYAGMQVLWQYTKLTLLQQMDRHQIGESMLILDRLQA